MAFRTYESLTQAAARTGLSVQDLRRSITAGELDAYRSGPRILRVDPIDVNMLRGQRHPMARIESTIGSSPTRSMIRRSLPPQSHDQALWDTMSSRAHSRRPCF